MHFLFRKPHFLLEHYIFTIAARLPRVFRVINNSRPHFHDRKKCIFSIEKRIPGPEMREEEGGQAEKRPPPPSPSTRRTIVQKHTAQVRSAAGEGEGTRSCAERRVLCFF